MSAPCARAPRRPELRVGSRGDHVVELQEQLRCVGIPLRVTGYFGSRSRAAVVRFQHARGLRMDGIVGERTWSALAARVACSEAG